MAPSTPVQDYALHVRAWQQHFGALFGLEAPRRVRSFSPSELALPNHPDVADAFVRTLVQAGYRWVLAQERAVEPSDGQGPRDPDLPRALSRSNCGGESAGILRWARRKEATPSRSPMQPYHEAHARARHARWAQRPTAGDADRRRRERRSDDERVRESSGSETPMLNGTEDLERVFAVGVHKHDLPVIPPLFQHRIWGRMAPGDGPERLAGVIEELSREDDRFNIEGGSWTNDVSWLRRHVLAVDDHVLATAAIRSWPRIRGTPRADRCRPRPSQRSTCSGRPGSGISGSTGVVVGGAQMSPARQGRPASRNELQLPLGTGVCAPLLSAPRLRP